MTQKLAIEGMMCGHCEMHVRKELEKIAGVTVKNVSHAENCAVIEAAEPVAEDVLKNAVETAGYTLTAVQ
mgnify:CR=1 FL=1